MIFNVKFDEGIRQMVLITDVFKDGSVCLTDNLDRGFFQITEEIMTTKEKIRLEENEGYKMIFMGKFEIEAVTEPKEFFKCLNGKYYFYNVLKA